RPTPAPTLLPYTTLFRSDPQRFGGRDLDVIDIMRVPKRRENRVRESKDQNVLRSFLAEKMVDPVSLFFGEGITDDAVEFARRSQDRKSTRLNSSHLGISY